MKKMQSCCIRGCDSYKQITSKNIGYFKFPLHDVFLLKKWLRQINRGNWKPSETSQICSAHFNEEDLAKSVNKKHVVLLPASVPTIFPIKKNLEMKRKISEEIVELNNDGLNDSEIKITRFEPHRNKVSLLRRKANVPSIKAADKFEIDTSKLKSRLIEPNRVNGLEIVSSDCLISQKPFLRITINKKLDIQTSSNPAPFETVFLPYHEENGEASATVKIGNVKCISQNNSDHDQNSLSVKKCSPRNLSAVTNISRSRSKLRKQYTKLKLKDSNSTKTLSQDHIYSCPPTAKVQSHNLKARHESDQLKRRLEELRERRKREQLKIVRLQMHLIELEQKMKENKQEEIVLPNLGQGSKPAGTKSSWLIQEKEEYEKLLKDVREIKLKVLRERHNQELEKIRRLQIQMTNLRKKMRENDEKEIALSNFKEVDNSAVARPDWMKKEEEEYEKLLQDVRKIKQSYSLGKGKNQDSVKSDSTKVFKCEKVLSDEDCALIETMQKSSKLMEDIEAGIELTDDNDDYGEVIGEIDEDSIDIDIKEATMLNFNEELPDPGLLDS